METHLLLCKSGQPTCQVIFNWFVDHLINLLNLLEIAFGLSQSLFGILKKWMTYLLNTPIYLLKCPPTSEEYLNNSPSSTVMLSVCSIKMQFIDAGNSGITKSTIHSLHTLLGGQ